jgi:hypothetical protein
MARQTMPITPTPPPPPELPAHALMRTTTHTSFPILTKGAPYHPQILPTYPLSTFTAHVTSSTCVHASPTTPSRMCARSPHANMQHTPTLHRYISPTTSKPAPPNFAGALVAKARGQNSDYSTRMLTGPRGAKSPPGSTLTVARAEQQ